MYISLERVGNASRHLPHLDARKLVAVGVIGFSGLSLLAGCGSEMPAPIQTVVSPGAFETASSNAHRSITAVYRDATRVAEFATAVATNMAPVATASALTAEDIQNKAPTAVYNARLNFQRNSVRAQQNVTGVVGQAGEIASTEEGRKALILYTLQVADQLAADTATAPEAVQASLDAVRNALSTTDPSGKGVGVIATQLAVCRTVDKYGKGGPLYQILNFQDVATNQAPSGQACNTVEGEMQNIQRKLQARPKKTPTPSSFNTGNRWRDLAVMRKMNKRNAEAMRARLSHSYT